MKIRCIIVDDDDAQIDNLERELAKYKELEVIRKYTDPVKFVLEQKKLDYDFAFLDIEMPALKGIEILTAIDNDIVFVSAYRKEYSERLLDLNNSSSHILGCIDKANLVTQLGQTLQKLIPLFKQRSDCLNLNFEGGLRKIKQNEISFITVLPDNIKDRRDKRLFKAAEYNFEQIKIKNTGIKDIAPLLNQTTFFQLNEHFIISKHLADMSNVYSDHIFIKLPGDINDVDRKQAIAVDKQDRFKNWIKK